MAKLTFLPDNKTIEFNLGYTILESAYDLGINIPSICQMGLCSTCMVKVEKGKEYLFENFGDDDFASPSSSQNVLSCVCELKDAPDDIEIVINIEQIT